LISFPDWCVFPMAHNDLLGDARLLAAIADVVRCA